MLAVLRGRLKRVVFPFLVSMLAKMTVSVRVPTRLRAASPPSSRMFSRGLVSQGSGWGARRLGGSDFDGGSGGGLGLRFALEDAVDQTGLLVAVTRGDGHGRGHRKRQHADEGPAEHPLGSGRRPPQTQMAGDDDGHPGERQHDQRDTHGEHGWPDGHGGQTGRVCGRPHADDEHERGEEGQHDAADDAAAGGDEAETGDNRSRDREQGRAGEGVLWRHGTTRRWLGQVPAPLIARRCQGNTPVEKDRNRLYCTWWRGFRSIPHLTIDGSARYACSGAYRGSVWTSEGADTGACASRKIDRLLGHVVIGKVARPSAVVGRLMGRPRLAVYGARLLSGLRAQPSRGFKSRRLRHFA